MVCQSKVDSRTIKIIKMIIINYLRPMHESVAKEKSAEILLIEAENEANNELLASFPTKSSEISAIFTRHPTRAKVSIYEKP